MKPEAEQISNILGSHVWNFFIQFLLLKLSDPPAKNK